MAGARLQQPPTNRYITIGSRRTISAIFVLFFDHFRRTWYNYIVKVENYTTFTSVISPDADYGDNFMCIAIRFASTGLSLRVLDIITIGGEAA